MSHDGLRESKGQMKPRGPEVSLPWEQGSGSVSSSLDSAVGLGSERKRGDWGRGLCWQHLLTQPPAAI